MVSGYNTEVMMDLLEEDFVGEGVSAVDKVCRSIAVRNQEVHLLSSQDIHLRHELSDAQAEGEHQLGIIKNQLARLNNNLSCLANRPAKRPCVTPPISPVSAAPDVGNEVGALCPPAALPMFAGKLSHCPRSIHNLRLEYGLGFSGKKAAKDFNEKERGADKYRYYRRNEFWDKVCEMVRAGFTAERACDKIYSAYGSRLSVTKIINAMICNKKTGGIQS